MAVAGFSGRNTIENISEFMEGMQYLMSFNQIPRPNNIKQLLFENTDRGLWIRKYPAMIFGSDDGDGVYEMCFRIIEEILCHAKQKKIGIDIQNEKREIQISCDSYSADKDTLTGMSVWLGVNYLSEYFEWLAQDCAFRTGEGLLSPDGFKDGAPGGIRAAFWPNCRVFGDIELDYYHMLDRFIELASLNPYEISFSDDQNKNVIRIPKGLQALLKTNPRYNREMVGLNINAPQLSGEIVIAFSYFGADCQKSFVNNYATEDGGVHVEGMIQGAQKALQRYTCEKNGFWRDTGEYIKSMNYVISAKADNAQWEGSVKRSLINPDIGGIIARQVEEQLYSKLLVSGEIIG